MIWTNKDDPTEYYTAKSHTPVRIEKPGHRLHVRFAYGSEKRLGPVSPWVELTRIDPPPYPLVVCKRATSGRMISWKANDETHAYSAWRIRQGKRYHGPFSMMRRTVTIPNDTDAVEIQWLSDEVRGKFEAVACRNKGDGSP